MTLRAGANVTGLLTLAVLLTAAASENGRAQDAKPATISLANSPQEVERTETLIKAAGELREKFWKDAWRPKYHCLPPSGWMNDPNGAIFWKGRYHLFYQHNPTGAYWDYMQWGHASSKDLVHWVHHPIALTPTPGGSDRDGCFSGVAVDNQGVATLVYNGIPDGICLATSQDDELLHWTKHPANPVIAASKPGQNTAHRIGDPCVWREGDSWRALTGWGPHQSDQGDTASLWKSADLVHWEYAHPFYQSRRAWTDSDEDCSVPDFFQLGNAHVLLFMSHKRGSQGYVGRYENETFHPERHQRMNWPGGQLICSATIFDAQGRRVFFGWINEGRSDFRFAGWAGVMTLPRILTLGEDRELRIEPAPELESLRLTEHRRDSFPIDADSELPIPEIHGGFLEIQLEMTPIDAKQFGLVVRCSPDGEERTILCCDRETGSFIVDGTKSSLIPWDPAALPSLPSDEKNCRAQRVPFVLADNEPLKLRLYLDGSVLEAFINGRQCVTQRIYPARHDSLEVRVFSRGGRTQVTSLKAWNLAGAE